MPSARLRTDERGFTLIELLVTMVILVVGMMGAVAMIDGANARTAVNAQREAGNALVREVLEDARSVPYAKLTPGGAVTQLQAISGLEDSDAGTLGWNVKRRNVTYTLTAAVCSVDDGKDNYGSHTGGNFCAGTAGTLDRNPDDYKHLTVKASWKRPGGTTTREVQQSTVIANEANTGGPDLSFTDQQPGGLGTTDINADEEKITFTVQTASQAAAIKYSVDGVVKGTDAPSGTTSSFDWHIKNGTDGHVPDGTYVISATAYDDDDRAGPTRSRTLRLNRDEPLAPTNFKGGWNALRSVVDLEWNRNNEPDVIGYRVFRTDSSGTQLVSGCEFINQPNATSCVDTNPPSDTSFVYFVKALDQDPVTGNAREGAASADLTATRSTDQPNQPPSLTASVSDPDLVLDWTLPPAAAPPYTGDTVIFYRIYRDGTAISDRYAVRSPGDVTSYKDGGEATGGHQYWITAVDQNYSESDPVGPVSAP